jgi:hypothetical protein
MPTCDLIASARALYNLNNLAVSGNETTTLAALIAAVSKSIAAYCGRKFCSTVHDELYNGDGQPRLLLRHYPILSVQRVAGCPTVVLRLRNTDTSNQRATVAVTDTGLTLTRVASGVSNSDTVAFATYPTLTTLAAAVTALGNGWSATVTANLDNFAAADLRSLQGAASAAQSDAGLRIHMLELTDFEIDPDRGWLLRRSPDQVWSGGVHYWRVIYTAGYTTIPEDVQEACAQWVAALFFQSKRDPGLLQEQIPGVISRTPLQGMPETVKTLLAPYRSHRILRTGG